MELKMVAGKTYALPTIFGPDRILEKGETFTVEDEKQAEMLLEETYTDALNNVHHYFVEVGSEASLEEDGKVRPPSRRRSAAKAKA